MSRTSLDPFLFDRVFDPVAHWVEAKTGVNNFSLARYSLAPYGAAFCGPVVMDHSASNIFLAGLTVMTVGICVLSSFASEGRAGKANFASMERMHPVSIFFRMLWLGLTASDVVFMLFGCRKVPDVIGVIGYLCFLYFVAGSPMPPGYREELEARRGRLATVHN